MPFAFEKGNVSKRHKLSSESLCLCECAKLKQKDNDHAKMSRVTFTRLSLLIIINNASSEKCCCCCLKCKNRVKKAEKDLQQLEFFSLNNLLTITHKHQIYVF